MDKISILEPEDFNPEVIRLLSNKFLIVLGVDYSATGLFSRFKYPLDRSFLSNFANLRFICTPTTGLSHIDCVYCELHDIRIISLKDCIDKISLVHSTSEFTILLMLSLLRNLHIINRSSLVLQDRMKYRGSDLSDQVVGILGIGRIGLHVYEYLLAFKCKIVCWDLDPVRLGFVDVSHRASSLEQLLCSCSMITVHASEQSDKSPILTSENFDLLTPGSYLINTARASLICRQSLYRNIRNNRIYGFASDVFWDEYSEGLDPELQSMSRQGFNILMTPHVGGCTLSSMQKTESFVCEILMRSHFANP
jgi:D-3-phosphoglycerate dehydrogenase